MVETASQRDKWVVVPTILVDGVLAVLGAAVSNIYLSLLILVLVCIVQLIAIWKLETFQRRSLNALFGVCVVIALAVLWYNNRPAQQPRPATRSDVHEEVNEALERLKTSPTPQGMIAPTPSASPSSSSTPRSPGKKQPKAQTAQDAERAFERERQRILRDLRYQKPQPSPSPKMSPQS